MPTALCASSHMRFLFLPVRIAKRSFTSEGNTTTTPETSATVYSTQITPMIQRLGSESTGRPTTRCSTSMNSTSRDGGRSATRTLSPSTVVAA